MTPAHKARLSEVQSQLRELVGAAEDDLGAACFFELSDILE